MQRCHCRKMPGAFPQGLLWSLFRQPTVSSRQALVTGYTNVCETAQSHHNENVGGILCGHHINCCILAPHWGWGVQGFIDQALCSCLEGLPALFCSHLQGNRKATVWGPGWPQSMQFAVPAWSIGLSWEQIHASEHAQSAFLSNQPLEFWEKGTQVLGSSGPSAPMQEEIV